MDARIIAGRARYGVTLFAPKGADGARAMLTSLAAGRSVAILNDQKYDGGSEGVFFGRPVRTNPAASRLARKFGAIIQPMSVQRTRGASFRVIVHEPIRFRTPTTAPPTSTAASTPSTPSSRRGCGSDRSEWWWMHRRWPAEVYRERRKDKDRLAVQLTGRLRTFRRHQRSSAWAGPA